MAKRKNKGKSWGVFFITMGFIVLQLLNIFMLLLQVNQPSIRMLTLKECLNPDQLHYSFRYIP